MTAVRIQRTLFSLLTALLVVGTAVPVHAQGFGVAGGLNFESAGDIKTQSSNATLENSTGYHVGLVYELGLGPVNVRPGFFYRKVGEFDLSQVDNDLQDPRYTVTAWEVPVDLRVPVFASPLLTPYVLGGPKFTIPRGEDEFDDVVEDLSYTLNVGVGAQISFPGSSFRLQPELLYEFGATGFIDEDKSIEIGDQNATFSPSESPKFSTFALRLNVFF